MNHEILIAELLHYGVGFIDKKGLESYLLDERQGVSWNKQESTESTLIIAVPLRSILGPSLFLIYINDIIKTSDRMGIVLVTEDTTVYSTGKSLNDSVY